MRFFNPANINVGQSLNIFFGQDGQAAIENMCAVCMIDAVGFDGVAIAAPEAKFLDPGL